jgi:hypothetical protein
MKQRKWILTVRGNADNTGQNGKGNLAHCLLPGKKILHSKIRLIGTPVEVKSYAKK